MTRRIPPLLAVAAVAAILSACTATFVPGDLVSDGWRRSEYRARPNRIDAEYRRGSLDLEAEVAHRGRDRVRVTLEIDD